MSDQYQEISSRLMAISEEIADLALADLRDSLEEGMQNILRNHESKSD